MQKKKITLSTIALWVLFAVTLVLFVVFFAGPQAEYALSTQGTTETSAILDPYLYWVYVVVGLGILLLIVFAIKSVLLGFQRDAKGTTQGLITIAAFVILFASFMSFQTMYLSSSSRFAISSAPLPSITRLSAVKTFTTMLRK